MSTRATRRDVLKLGGGLIVVSTLAGCTGGGGGDGGDGQPTVEMTDDLVFEPDSITIDAGDTVVWENTGSVDHTVTAYQGKVPDGAAYFASGGFDAEQAARDAYPSEGGVAGGESFRHTFETAGTYEYFCIPHESAGMTGTIEVQEP